MNKTQTATDRIGINEAKASTVEEKKKEFFKLLDELPTGFYLSEIGWMVYNDRFDRSDNADEEVEKLWNWHQSEIKANNEKWRELIKQETLISGIAKSTFHRHNWIDQDGLLKAIKEE